jgi:Amidohydrolase family
MTRSLKAVAVGCALIAALTAPLILAGGAEPEAFVIKAARIFTSGPAGVLRDAALLVENGKIKRIIRDGNLPSVPVRDHSGLTIIPCLVDAHTYVSGYKALLGHTGPMTPDLPAYAVFNPGGPEVREALLSGIGTVNLSPDNRNVVGGISSVLRLPAGFEQPIVFRKEAFLKVSLNSEAVDPEKAPTSLMGSEDMLDEAVRTARRGPGPRDGVFGQRALRSLADGSLRPIVAASSLPEVQTALAWLERWGLAGIVLGGEEAGPFVEELKRKDIPVLLSPIQFSSPEKAAENAVELLNGGVQVAFVSDMPEGRPLDLRYSALALCRLGVTQEEALKTITIFPARILGVGERVGSIEEGKDADLVVLSGDPLDLGARISAVYIDGRLAGDEERPR